MNKDSDRTSSPSKSQPVFGKSNVVLEALAYVGAAAASALTMWANVRENFTAKLKRGVFKHLDEARAEKRALLGDQLASGTITKAQFDTLFSASEQECASLWKTGVHNLGIKNFLGRFNYINRFDRAKTIALGATVFSIAVGAIVAAKDRREMINKIHALEEDQKAYQKNTMQKQNFTKDESTFAQRAQSSIQSALSR